MSTHRNHACQHPTDPQTATNSPFRALVSAALLVLAVTACQPATAHADPVSHTTAGAAGGSARVMLDALPVRVEDTGAHYRRQDWGGWTSRAGGGCDTRETILIRDAQPGSIQRGPSCRILAGEWVSPYDGASLSEPRAVQIDHRVPVKEANRSGARTWSRAQRGRFYNDPANLIAVSAHSNTSKGDDDPGRWRPTNRDAWCGYARAYIATKHTYRLSVDSRERAGLVAMLNTCGGAR